MDLSFDDHTFNRLVSKIGFPSVGTSQQMGKILIPLTFLWLPLVIITLIQGTFWTGETDTSFITNFDTQVRFLVSMPIFILAEKLLNSRLGVILNQFLDSGVIHEKDKSKFESLIHRQVRFLKSPWTLGVIFLLCYLQVFLVLFYESENTSFLSWQLTVRNGDPALNLAGLWCTLLSRPFVLFLFYRWMLKILVWGNLLRKISKFNLNLYPEHPDLSGGLGYLGYAIRYFSPIAFAISATLAGNMADFVLIEGMHVTNLKLPALAYFIFMSLLFALPLLSFTGKLINARESSVFDNYDFANGMYQQLRVKISKRYDQVNKDDLDSSAYSSVSDYNAVVDNVLKMKFVPFTWKDMVPLWVMTALPFLAVIALEIPLNELFTRLFSVLV